MWISAFFFLHFAIYTAFRLEFLIWNWASLKVLSDSHQAQAFLHGVRFDLAALAAHFGLFVLFLIWLHKPRIAKIFLFFCLTTVSIFLILVNSVDVELVNFTGRRFSKASAFLINEGHVANLITPYVGLAVFTFSMLGIYFVAAVYFFRKIQFQLTLKKKIIFSIILVCTSVLLFRGGFQLKPMSAVEARLFPETMANHLVLNSTFTLLKSFNKSSIERVHYFEHEKMLQYLNRSAEKQKKFPQFKKENVVIIILESFSKEYTRLKNPEFTPFLNQLSKEGVLFENSYANARRSIEGIGAVLAGIPALMEEPFINSEFSSNEFIGLGQVLTEQGYHTSFFHGAKNGSMHFDAFAKSAGIQNYYGETEYPESQDNDGTWGIYDGPFLNWACSKMSSFPQPFMASVFTLSSHQPYSIPPAEKNKHPQGSHPILQSIHYTDQALKNFFSCARNQNWFTNTLFVITADHAGPSLNTDADFKSKFEIPILFYTADRKKIEGLDFKQPAQQIDILPTLLETLHIEQKMVSYLSRSLWHPGPKVIALYSDGVYELAGNISDAENQLKAIRQYFSEGLFDNRLYYPAGSSTK